MSEGPLIVIVCGSRDWTDRLAIFGDLDWLLARSSALEIVHGACSKGALGRHATQSPHGHAKRG